MWGCIRRGAIWEYSLAFEFVLRLLSRNEKVILVVCAVDSGVERSDRLVTESALLLNVGDGLRRWGARATVEGVLQSDLTHSDGL